LAEGNFFAEMELERQRLEQKRQEELALAEKTGADKALINKKFDKLIEDNNKAVQEAKLAMTAQTFGAMSKLLGEESKAGKAFALAQALINTYQGITKALTLPFPANIAAAATTAATGFAAVKQITATKTPKAPKAARGIVMDIDGRSHAQGGETFYDASGNPVVEAQGGEKMVILKKEASRELDALSALNQKHGGVSLSTPVTYANNGGAVIRPAISSGSGTKTQNIDYERLSSLLAERVNAIQAVVPVDRINDLNLKNARVQSGANM